MSDATAGNVTTPAEPGRDSSEDQAATPDPVPVPVPVPGTVSVPGTGELPTTEPDLPSPASVATRDPEATPPPGPEDETDNEPDAGTGPAAGTEPDAGTEPADGAASGPAPAGDFRLALVSAVKVDLPNQHPTVVLRETESPRRQLSFSVGLQDGVVLSHAMRRIPTPRPLTHELLTGILQGFDIDIVAVRLVGRQGAIYFAELDLRGRTGRSVHSCRPSDALTIALHQPVPVPILIDRRLLEESGDVAPAGSSWPPA